MTRSRLFWIALLVTGTISGALLLSRALLPGASAAGGDALGAEPKIREQDREATTRVLPNRLVTLRVDFRSKGKAAARTPTTWDGQVSVSPGRVHGLRLWKEDPRNSVEESRWKITTRRRIPMSSGERKRGLKAMPLEDVALVVELADVKPETEIRFETEQGNFNLGLGDVPFGGRKAFLKGLVAVSRMANAAIILSAPTEDDFPSAAVDGDGRLHVAYVAFTHGEDFRRRGPLPEPPKDLEYLAQPTGGDQLLLMTLDKDRWAGPVAVTSSGEDIYRTAVAIDGTGGIWVFWSGGRDGNWDIYARRRKGDAWSRELRLTTDPGPDTFPAAATDSSGRVWLAWQAFRGGNSDIIALRQDGDGFGAPMIIATGPANEWTPAIATSRDGSVAIAWDTYEKGDYDVYARIWTNGEFRKPIPVATTMRAEMRPSITYDTTGALWVAYEDSPEKWGKDWGALEKEGVALYQGRSVAVRVWSKNRLWKPVDDPVNAFQPGRRAQGAQAQRRGSPRLAFPKMTTDAGGRVWLLVRSPRMGTRVGVGTAWFTHAAWYDGDRWSGETVCPRTDNILDNRPALAPVSPNRVLLVASADGRFATTGRLPQWMVRQLRREGQRIENVAPESPWPDAVNNELVLAEFQADASGPAGPAKLEPVPPDEGAGGDAKKAGASADRGASREAADVRRAREARVTIGGKTLRLWRGEFHRHTEISQDGGGDGAAMDMWRYGLDAASLDWIGFGDHDNGAGREYSWWISQKTTDVFHVPGVFTPPFTYERSCTYPDGHRNVVFAKRGIRTLPRLQGGQGKAMDELGEDANRPNTPDTQLLYRYLAQFDGVCASHTSGTDMGTDWRDNNAKVEPIVEIYQGCRQSYEMPGAPRSNTAKNSIGGWRPFGFVSLALKKGYRLGFQASSDHVSTHISYCNAWVEEPTREGILAAMKARHVYGSTDNIIADVRCGDHFMGDEFSVTDKPKLRVHIRGTRPLAKVHVVKDGNYVHTVEPGKEEAEFEWSDFDPTPGKTSYYYVRGEQEDGELVWVSPMWITYRP